MRYCYSKSYVLKSWSPGNISTHDAYHSSAHWGFFNLAFSSIDLALISCPDFSSKRDMSNHRGIALGHFFSCTTKFVYRDEICNEFNKNMQLSQTVLTLNEGRSMYSDSGTTYSLVVCFSCQFFVVVLLLNLSFHHPQL